MVMFPLKCTLMPYLPQMCLKLSTTPFVYGMTTCPTVELGPGLGVFVLAP